MLGNPSPLADLLDSVLQLVSLEEDDEDGLVDLVSLWGHRTVKTESDRSRDSDDAVKKHLLYGLWWGPPEGLRCLPVSGTRFLGKPSTASSQTWESSLCR